MDTKNYLIKWKIIRCYPKYIIKSYQNFDLYTNTLFRKNYPNLGVKYFYKDLLYLDFKKNHFDVTSVFQH